jgi:FMN phosphatase YigB (HAD superfamily)
MIPGIRCFLLDLGKVLVDIDLGRLGASMQVLTGIGPVELHAAFTGNGLVAHYESGRISNQEFYSEFNARTGRRISFDDFASAWNAIFVPGQILGDAVIARLASLGDLWVISNTNPLHFGYVRENYAFLRHFRGCILSYEVGALKPDPAIFHAACARTGIAPEETVFVDDLLSHVETARSLGFQAIQFTGPSDLDPLLY